MTKIPTLTPAEIEELDEVLRDGGIVAAAKHVKERFMVGLAAAMAVVIPRRQALFPDPSLEEQEATARERFGSLSPEGAVAVQAEWDGDTTGWFVRLEVMFADHHDPQAVYLAALRGPGGDMRLFNGQLPPWPEPGIARRLGREFAETLGVPFVFVKGDGPGPGESGDA